MITEGQIRVAELNAELAINSFRSSSKWQGYPKYYPGMPPRNGRKFIAYYRYPRFPDKVYGPVELYWFSADEYMKGYWGNDLDGFSQTDKRPFDVPWELKMEIVAWHYPPPEKRKAWWKRALRFLWRGPKQWDPVEIFKAGMKE